MSKTKELIKITFGVLVFMTLVLTAFYFGFLKTKYPVGKHAILPAKVASESLSGEDLINLLETQPKQAEAIMTLDTDYDDLSDYLEGKYLTDPVHADTDRDGFADGQEVLSGYNAKGKFPFPRILVDSSTWQIYQSNELQFYLPPAFYTTKNENGFSVNSATDPQSIEINLLTNPDQLSFANYINAELSKAENNILLELVQKTNSLETLRVRGKVAQRLSGADFAAYLLESEKQFIIVQQNLLPESSGLDILNTFVQRISIINNPIP